MTWKVELPMYNVSPRLQREYEAFAACLLAQAEVEDDVREDVLLTQTCGYPYMTSQRSVFSLLATPCFDFPGCEGSDYSSVIVTRAGSEVRSLADARGLIAAANEAHSNSGMNVLRHAVSRLAQNGRFFGDVKWTGSHAASLRMVQQGEADIAAIDCVTYGYIKEEQPGSIEGTTILQYTARTPGLPLVSARTIPEELQTRLRNALLSPGAALQAQMQTLRINGFQACTDGDYNRILDLEAAAQASGYPTLN